MDKKYISDNKRVILITGDETKWFEQAIFIVKKGAAEKSTPTDFIREAELIIQNYMTGKTQRTPRVPEAGYSPAIRESGARAMKKPPAAKRSAGAQIAVNMVIIAVCTVILLIVSRGILG